MNPDPFFLNGIDDLVNKFGSKKGFGIVSKNKMAKKYEITVKQVNREGTSLGYAVSTLRINGNYPSQLDGVDPESKEIISHVKGLAKLLKRDIVTIKIE